MFLVFKPGPAMKPLWILSPVIDGASCSTSGIYENFGRTDCIYIGNNSSFSQFFVYNVQGSTNSWGVWANGNLHISGSTPYARFNAAYPGVPSIGRTFSSSMGYYSYGDLEMAEFIIYNTKLTPAQRTSVTKYLVNKYKLGDTNTPPKPTLTATPASWKGVSLAWTVVNTTNWIGTKIERRTGTGSFSEIARVANDFGYFDSTISTNQTYTYRVKLYNFNGDSAYWMRSPSQCLALPKLQSPSQTLRFGSARTWASRKMAQAHGWINRGGDTMRGSTA